LEHHSGVARVPSLIRACSRSRGELAPHPWLPRAWSGRRDRIDSQTLEKLKDTIASSLTDVAFKIVAALFFWIGGVTGTVREIGLFGTVIDTPDNIHITVGNNKILSDNIINYSANAYRRVDLTAQLSDATDVKAAVALLRERIVAIPNVAKDPEPVIEILDFNLVGPVLAVRPYCHNDHYWQVYFATNQVLKHDLAQFPSPASSHTVHLRQVG
jgi:small-conductance mechanosensitive channel